MIEFKKKRQIKQWMFRVIGICSVGSVIVAAAYHNKDTAVHVSTQQTANGIICSVNRTDRAVSLTFDCAWGNQDTEQILTILKKHNVHASFFVTGEWADAYPSSIENMIKEGHDIGNHTQTHRDLVQLKNNQVVEEIETVHTKIKQLTGQDMKLFRFPYDSYNPDTIKLVKDMGYECIQWSIDSMDWRDYGKEIIIKNILEHENMKPGAIILMNNGAEETVDALETIVIELKYAGYQFVPVSELLVSKENMPRDE